MDSKNRLVIVVTVTMLIILAMFTSFGRNLFALNTPSVTLPSAAGSAAQDSSTQDDPAANAYPRVAVTAQTVQNVIGTLTRKDSYFRELTVELFWAGGSSLTGVQAWVDRGWSHTVQALPSGLRRHELVGEDTLYYWYEGTDVWHSAPGDAQSFDLSARVPTYETVLDLDASLITDAGYEVRGELPCIYVSVQHEDDAYVQRYWVSIDSGLLIAAEMEKDGELTYRMTGYTPIESPCPTDASFTLPDGAILHEL
jgi:hypothetical protein